VVHIRNESVVSGEKEFFDEAVSGDKLKMGLIGLAFLGVVIGAAGTEFLRVKRPDIIEKIEDAARRFVASVCLSESDDKKTQK